MKVRNTTLKIYSGGSDIFPALENFITSFKYSDSIKSEADTCEIVLADAAGTLLRRGVIPAKNSELSITIVKNNWNTQALSGDSSLSLPLGSFELDKITYQSPPTTLTLKLTSIPSKKGLRGVERNFSWEHTQLRRIAADIAGRAGLQLFYDAEEIEIERAEQNEPDLSFLKKLCRNNGLNLKIADKKLILFDAEKYEEKSPVITLKYGGEVIKRFSFEAKSDDIYSGANVNFLGNGISDLLSDFGIDFGEFGGIIGGAVSKFVEGGGDDLNINEHVANMAEAEKLKKSRLHNKNKDEFTARFTLSGSFSFLAGNCFNVEGFGGIFDGKYFIQQSNHTISDGYSTEVTAYKCEG